MGLMREKESVRKTEESIPGDRRKGGVTDALVAPGEENLKNEERISIQKRTVR